MPLLQLPLAQVALIKKKTNKQIKMEKQQKQKQRYCPMPWFVSSSLPRSFLRLHIYLHAILKATTVIRPAPTIRNALINLSKQMFSDNKNRKEGKTTSPPSKKRYPGSEKQIDVAVQVPK